MACTICNRSSCVLWMHSIQEIEAHESGKCIDCADYAEQIETLTAQLEERDVKIKKLEDQNNQLWGILKKQQNDRLGMNVNKLTATINEPK